MKRDWETWGICSAGTLVTYFGFGNYWNTTWLSKWAILLSLFLLATPLHLARKTSWLHLPLILYTLASLTALGIWSPSPYQTTLDPVTLLALQKNALFALVQVLALFTLVSVATRQWAFGVLLLLATTWAVGVGSILMQPLLGAHSPPMDGLWFGNPSMGASLLACLLPFAWAFSNTRLFQNRRRRQMIFVSATWLVTLAAIYRTGASVPWGVLGVVSAAAIVASNFTKLRSLLYPSISIAVLGTAMILIGRHSLGADFWDQNGRFEIWRMAYDQFWASANPWFGFGFSSGQIFTPIQQMTTGHFHGDYFLWLHNDWLQLAVEGGYVGMFCVFLSVGRLLTVSWRHPAIFASLCGFITLACFNYPLRMPIHCFCLALVCGLAEALKTTRSVRMRVPTLAEAAQRSRLQPLSRSDLLAARSCSQSQEPNRNLKPSY